MKWIALLNFPCQKYRLKQHCIVKMVEFFQSYAYNIYGWWLVMYIKRNIENKLIEASNQFASITIYGPRQVGKSTLIEKVFPNIN